MINNILFKPLLLFLMVLCFVGCHHEEACFLGRVEQKENNNYFVRVVEAPEDFSRIGPPSLLIFPEGNLSETAGIAGGMPSEMMGMIPQLGA